MQKRAPQIPVNEFLESYREVAESDTPTVAALADVLGRDVDSVGSRISQLRKKYPKLDQIFDELPLTSGNGGSGGRKRVDESDLLAIFGK